MLGANIFGVIVYKLCFWQKPSLIILFEVHKNLKIGFHVTV